MPLTKHDFITANRAYFDENARNYDDNSHSSKLAKRIALAILEIYDFDEETTTVMDFACGAGHMSRQLAQYAKSVVGIDISQAMVDLYNKRVDDQGISHEEMHAECVELKGEDDELGGTKFDVIICCMGYHHFPDVEEYTKILSFFLKPLGCLIIADFQALNGGSISELETDEYSHIVAHPSGFSDDTMTRALGDAGLRDISVETISNGKMHGRDARVFLAKGSKAGL